MPAHNGGTAIASGSIREEVHAREPRKETALLESFDHVEHEEMGEGTHAHYLKIADDLAERFGVPKVSAGAAPEHSTSCCGHHGRTS